MEQTTMNTREAITQLAVIIKKQQEEISKLNAIVDGILKNMELSTDQIESMYQFV